MNIYRNTMKMVIEYYLKGNYGKIAEIFPNSTVRKNRTVEENLGTYEIKKNLFGKEKVRKVKNETRTLGIEYSEK